MIQSWGEKKHVSKVLYRKKYHLLRKCIGDNKYKATETEWMNEWHSIIFNDFIHNKELVYDRCQQ